MVTMPIRVGPKEIKTEVVIINSPSLYRMILGRPWLAAMEAVPSTRHQCLKFPFNGKIIRVDGESHTHAPEVYAASPAIARCNKDGDAISVMDANVKWAYPQQLIT